MESATLERNGASNGEGDLPGESAEEQPKLPPVEVVGHGQLSFEVGGMDPDKATVKLRGGSIGIPEGQYEKGDVVDLLVRVRCDSVAFIDKHDNTTGAIVETERRHGFTVTRVEKV